MYELFFFCADEDGEPIETVREGLFDTEDEALDRLDNIGSKWFFYPNAYIIHPNGETEFYYAN